MKKLEGYTVIEETADRLVLEKHVPGKGTVRLIGNPHPDPAEQQKNINELGDIIERSIARRKAEERLAAEKAAEKEEDIKKEDGVTV